MCFCVYITQYVISFQFIQFSYLIECLRIVIKFDEYGEGLVLNRV